MRIPTRVVRGGAWLGLFLAVGYEAADAATGTISVQVWQGSVGVAATGATIEIVQLNTFSSTNAQGRASLTVPAGSYTVRATLTGFCNSSVSVVVQDAQLITITFVLGTSPCSGPGGVTVTSAPDNSAGASTTGGGGSSGGGGGGGVDRIITGGTHPFYALVDIRTAAASDPAPCENDRLRQATAGVADLGINALTLSAPGVTCHGAAWVFTEDHAPWFSNTAASMPWTDADGNVLTTTLPAERLRVPVTVWISYAIPASTKNAFLQKMTLDLPKVNDFLKVNRTGLLITNSETGIALPDIIDVGLINDPSTGGPPFPIIGIGCANTPSIINSSLVYRPNHINIYVVENIDGAGSASGRNCVAQGASNVIFIKETSLFQTYLHEIGHALGLNRPQWGHANNISGLYPGNFMTEGGLIAENISLGQIARMHVDDISWLNRGHGTVGGSVRSRQAVSSPTMVTSCGCPNDAITDDCPRLDKDISRSPLVPNAVTTVPACFVATNPLTTCIPLAPGATTTIKLEGFLKSGGATGAGDGMVASMSPTLATVTKPAVGGEGAGWVKAQVTAGATPGVTDLLMWLGGTGVKIPIHIGSPCP